MSTVIRTYLVLVSFVDTRIKPRTVVVEAKGRSAARKAARALIADKHPTWEIDMAQATVESQAEAPAKVEGKVEAPKRKAPAARKGAKPVPPKRPMGVGSRGGDPLKAAAWAHATVEAEKDGIAIRSPHFIATYKAELARLQAESNGHKVLASA